MSRNTYFTEIASDSGIIINYDGGPNMLSQEQSLVLRDIKRSLQNHISYPENVREVITGLKSLCEDENHFKNALIPTVFSKSNNSQKQDSFEANKVYQDSIFRILLSVECLQSDVIEMLVDNIKSEASKETENTSWLRMLLNPLKYLPFIENEAKLTDKIIETLENSYYTSQIEIINVLPDILPDSQHCKIATTLCELIESNSSLTAAAVDCMNSLELTNDTKSRIQEKILAIITEKPVADIFSILFEFLVSDSNTQSLTTVMSIIRTPLNTIMCVRDDKEQIQTSKTVIVNHLSSLMLTLRPLRESIGLVVNTIKTHVDHKPVDLLLLIILYGTGNKNSKVTVETTFRKRIKGGFFRIPLLEELFNDYYLNTEILKEYLDTILDLSTTLLQSQKDESVLNFTATIYNLLFNHKKLEKIQRQDIINSLVLLAGTHGQKYASSVLNILLSFSKNKVLLQGHTVQLMGLLELLDSLELKDVGKVFDLLCSLTCRSDASSSASGFKDELHMLVRKQLSSNNKRVKFQGIVSAIMMVKHLAISNEDQSEDSLSDRESSVNLSDLPPGAPQEAAKLLELTNTNTLNNPEFLGLFYDQLALLIMTTANLEKYFLAWLFDSMTNDFRKIYITDVVPEPINDTSFSMQYALNDREETRAPIAVNIAGLSMKSSGKASILTLSPLFRLVRLLHVEDLTTIDALLWCGVVMPVVDNINDFDTHQVKYIVDCLFHSINWFREVVSAFVKQKSRQTRYKVLERVNHIIHLESKLMETLVLVPDHTLPKSYFDSAQELPKVAPKSDKMKPPRKKQKTCSTTQILNDTTTSVATQASKSSSNKANKSSMSRINHNINFRELDTDVILLLRYSLKFEEFNTSHGMSLTQQPTLTIKQFNFLMKDIVTKAKALTKETISDLSHFKVVSVENFISDCVNLLPHIMKNFQAISTAIGQAIEQSDHILDSPDMFSSTMRDLRSSFGNVLELISTLLNWPGLQSAKNKELLRNLLNSLLKELSPDLDKEEQVLQLSRVFTKFSKQCLCLSTGIHLIKILKAFYQISLENDIKKKCAIVSEKLLMKRWYNLNGAKESGMMANLNLDILINTYFDGISVETLCSFVASLESEIETLITKEDYLSKLQAIDKSNFFILFKGICTALSEGVKNEIVNLTNSEHLSLWKNTALTLHGLISVLQKHDSKTNFSNFLKKSLAILRVFLSHGIPILEIVLRSKPDEVLEIFRILQKTTKFLHHLCCASKLTKDISLVSYVPQFRLILESILLRVKAALAANNCSSAFWMGTLKNRNLQGEDIATQSSVDSSGNEPEEELPPEDSDEDIIEDQEGNEENGSVSDVY